jgi:hypothetical protein
MLKKQITRILVTAVALLLILGMAGCENTVTPTDNQIGREYTPNMDTQGQGTENSDTPQLTESGEYSDNAAHPIVGSWFFEGETITFHSDGTVTFSPLSGGEPPMPLAYLINGDIITIGPPATFSIEDNALTLGNLYQGTTTRIRLDDTENNQQSGGTISNGHPIIGSWLDGEDVLTFYSDGTVTLSELGGGETFPMGSYFFINDDTITVGPSEMFTIEDDVLTLVVYGDATRLTRLD